MSTVLVPLASTSSSFTSPVPTSLVLVHLVQPNSTAHQVQATMHKQMKIITKYRQTNINKQQVQMRKYSQANKKTQTNQNTQRLNSIIWPAQSNLQFNNLTVATKSCDHQIPTSIIIIWRWPPNPPFNNNLAVAPKYQFSNLDMAAKSSICSPLDAPILLTHSPTAPAS